MVLTVSEKGAELFDAIGYLTPEEQEQVRTAFEFAENEHCNQFRKSGEPFITHPATVAYYLAEYHLNRAALIAALLHDVAEDCTVSVEEIGQRFGKDVASIVDGVTKFEETDAEKAQQLTPQQKANATYGKLFQEMTRDVRAVLIKLFDRLHNMRTMGSMPEHKQRKKAQETLTVYAPLANRLGMWAIKNELESRAFRILDPQRFNAIEYQLYQRQLAHEKFIARISETVGQTLEQWGVEFVRIEPSYRNANTIFRKAVRKDKSGNSVRIDHVPRVVIIVKDRQTCYQALGAIHETWSPIRREFDDYIASPRENLYRALHTTVKSEKGREIKLRVRTEAMSLMSEIGVLARWGTRDSSLSSNMRSELDEQVQALLDGISMADEESANVDDAVQRVVEDVLTDQITLYTPNGDVRRLPEGSTALDFAYSIHTAIGDSARRAYANDEQIALNVPLNDGQRVAIQRYGRHPVRIWLDEDLEFLHTSRAKSHIRRWFRRLSNEVAIKEGKKLLQDELRLIGQGDYDHRLVGTWFGYESEDALYRALGHADLLSTSVAEKVLMDRWQDGRVRTIGKTVASKDGEKFFVLGGSGFGKLQMCRMCDPRPGDSILGYVKKNGRVTIHNETCHLLPPETRKLLRLRWGLDAVNQVRQVPIAMDVYDRSGLLYEVTDLLRTENINIAGIHTSVETMGEIRINALLEVKSPRQLVSLLHRIQTLANVRDVFVMKKSLDRKRKSA